MKVKVIHKKSGIEKSDNKFIEYYIRHLQKNFPLKTDLEIHFLGERNGEMTTGSRLKHKLKILSKNRIMRDILRTLSHEWVHEYQREIMGLPKGKDIGGKNENMANAEAGKLIKKFEKDNPKKIKSMYKEF